MDRIEFTVFAMPAPGGSKRGFVNPKTGRVIITEDCKRSKPWREHVTWAAKNAGAQKLEGPLMLKIEFAFPRPKAHKGTGKNADKIKPQYSSIYVITKPDLTKLVRSTEDALKNICWHDDSQVAVQVLRKIYTLGDPYAKITVSRLKQEAADGK